MLTESERYEAACSGKRAYTRKPLAKKAAVQAMSCGGHALDVYRCTFCLQWHLGSKKRPQTRQQVAS